MSTVDVLIPTYQRPSALALTLSTLASQTNRDFRITISDQSENNQAWCYGELMAVLRLLRLHGHEVRVHKHLPRQGMAEHRQFLLDHAEAKYSLFLDDDVLLEPDVVERMLRAIREEACGFVGCAVIGLSYLEDVRPQEQEIEFWDGRVQPEQVRPDGAGWDRHRLHNAANLLHVQRSLKLAPGEQRKYRVAWVGGCVMFDTDALRACGGFGFWRELPPAHCGEDVMAQIRVMSRYGGCGLVPSGVYHQELPTKVEDRTVDAPRTLNLEIAARTDAGGGEAEQTVTGSSPA